MAAIPKILIDKIDINDCLSRLGIKPHAVKINEIVARCPNPDHEDTHPTWSINIDRTSEKFGLHHCFSCGFSGSITYLWSRLRRINPSIGINELKSIYVSNEELRDAVYDEAVEDYAVEKSGKVKPIKYVDVPYEFEYIRKGSEHWNYLNSRGVSDEVIKNYKIGFCDPTPTKYKNHRHEEYRNQLIIPIFFGGNTVGFMARDIHKKRFSYNDDCPISQIFFNWDEIEINTKRMKATEIFCVEGIFDALRVLSTNFLQRYRKHSNIVAFLGNTIGGKGEEQPRARLLRMADRVVSMSDGDAGGDIMRASIVRHLRGHTQLYEARMDRGYDPGDLPLPVLKNRIMRPRPILYFEKPTKVIVDYGVE